jgi:hypothetical protein
MYTVVSVALVAIYRSKQVSCQVNEVGASYRYGDCVGGGVPHSL